MNYQLSPIEECKLYPLPIFQAVSGLGKAAMANCFSDGLPFRRVGVRKYIYGRDFIEFVAKHGATNDTGPQR